MIRAVVFDFGKVVAHFDHGQITERLAVHAELPADEIHRYLFGGQLEDDYESGRLSSDAFLQQVRQVCRLRCPDDYLHTAYADIFSLNREVCELLPRLKSRYRLILLSNTNDLHARHFRRQFADTLGHFDHLVLSHEVGFRKPRPEVFEHCRRLAGCAAAACLFIDDLPENVTGAKACGWHGIVYHDIHDLRRQMAALGIAVE